MISISTTCWTSWTVDAYIYRRIVRRANAPVNAGAILLFGGWNPTLGCDIGQEDKMRMATKSI